MSIARRRARWCRCGLVGCRCGSPRGVARVDVQAAVHGGLVRFVWLIRSGWSLFSIFFSVFVDVLYVVYLWPSLIHAAENLYLSLILFLARLSLEWNAGHFGNGVQGFFRFLLLLFHFVRSLFWVSLLDPDRLT